MKQRLFEEMPAEEFELALDRFIVREPAEIPTSVFFEALAQIDREKQSVAPVIRLLTRVVGNRLVFASPDPTGDIAVRGNEIVLEDGRHILFELIPDWATSMTPS